MFKTEKLEKVHSASRITLLLVFLVPFALIFMPFFVPILMAVFVAFGIDPMLKKLSSRAKDRKYVAAALILIAPLFFWVPFFIFAARILNGLKYITTDTIRESQLSQSLLLMWDKVQTYGNQIIQAIGADQNIIPSKEELFEKISPIVVKQTTTFISALPELGLDFFVFFCILFLLLSRSSLIKRFILNSNILPADEVEQTTQHLRSSCHMILVSTVLIGALQALIVSVGSSVFGYREFFLVFTITFFVSFIPVIGAAPVAMLLAILSFLNGHNGDGIGLVVVGIVAGTIDNILKPYLLSNDDKNLHPLVSLIGIVGAIIVFGLPGLWFGPLITQLTVKLGPLLAKRIVQK